MSVPVDHDDGLVTITINRPEKRNAIDGAVTKGVTEAVDELEARDDLRVGILTGAGGTFCSGMDLAAFVRGEMVRTKERGLLGIACTPPTTPLEDHRPGAAEPTDQHVSAPDRATTCTSTPPPPLRDTLGGYDAGRFGGAPAAARLLVVPFVRRERLAVALQAVGSGT